MMTKGFTSDQWDSDIKLLNITQQEVDDLREARAGRPFSRQPFSGKDGGEAEETAAEEANPENDGPVDGEESSAALDGLNDIAQEWRIMEQHAHVLEGELPPNPHTPASPTDTHNTNEHVSFVYLRFKYTHGVYRVHTTSNNEVPTVNIGDMVVVRGAHRHEGGDGGTTSAENVGTVVADATSLVHRAIEFSKEGTHSDRLDTSTKDLIVAGHPVDTLLRCTTNKDRKMFYQARRREASTSSCAERIVQTLKLPLAICDCEFQSDFGRLILFFKLTTSHLDELVKAGATKVGADADAASIRREIVAASVRVLLKEMHNQFHCRVWALDWDTELEMLFPLGQLGPIRGRQRRDARGRIVPLTVLPAVRLPRPVNVVASVVKRKKKRKNDEDLPHHTGDIMHMTKMPMMTVIPSAVPPQYRPGPQSDHTHLSHNSAPYHPPSPMSNSSSFIPSMGATVGVPSPHAAASPGGFYSFDSPYNQSGYAQQRTQQSSMPAGMYAVPGGTFIPHPPMLGGYPSPMHNGFMGGAPPVPQYPPPQQSAFQSQQYHAYMPQGYPSTYPQQMQMSGVRIPMPPLNGGSYY
jgi:hypothetical protein